MIITEKNNCTGCTACEKICPLNAITMLPDEEGFLYPVIDTNKCVECGKCKATCPSNKNVVDELVEQAIEPKVYAARIKNEEIRSISTSGGAFSAIAENVLKSEGVIYGAKFDMGFKVIHARAENADEYGKFRGSKYVQSELGGTFNQVKKDLLEEKKVLFTGTPCQVAGLYAFLGNGETRKNLLTCEIVCHGVPSPLMWKEHLVLIEKEKKSKIIDYKNRSKVAGWNCHNEHFFLENGKSEYKTKLSQNHKDLFYSHYIIRPVCHECKYAGFPRVADFSIADFWGIENIMPDFYDNKGTSMIVINTEKGVSQFEELKTSFDYRESDVNDAFKNNHKKPSRRNVKREQFWNDYKAKGYLYVVRKYASYSTFGKIKIQTKFKIKKLFKVVGLYKLIHAINLKMRGIN